MTDKLLNVLDEIKRLKVTRAPKSNIYIHPNKYDMNKHAAATSVKSYTTKLYGNEGKRYNINESHYKDSIFEGFTGKMEQDHFHPVYSEKATSNYMNKLFGIPDVKEFSNNDNTIYYEQNLGNKSELDFAVEHFDDAEMNPDTILEENDKAYNLNRLRTALNNKKVKTASIKASVAPEVAAAKAAKTATSTATAVTVAPAFAPPISPNTPSTFVQPAFVPAALAPLTKGESGLQKLAKKLKSATVIKDTLRRQYDMKRYDKAKTAAATAEPVVTRSQSETTPRTPLTKKGKK